MTIPEIITIPWYAVCMRSDDISAVPFTVISEEPVFDMNNMLRPSVECDQVRVVSSVYDSFREMPGPSIWTIKESPVTCKV